MSEHLRTLGAERTADADDAAVVCRPGGSCGPVGSEAPETDTSPADSERAKEPSMRIDIWTDIACPFCYLGKAAFEQALETFEYRDRVEIVHHSFQLDPDLPVEYPGDAHAMVAEELSVPVAQARVIHRQLTERAAALGLTYDIDALIPTNTRDAHRLVHFAREHGKQGGMVGRLFRAHYTEGRHVGRPEVLAGLAAELGLDRDEALAMLKSDRYHREVEADIQQARQYGTTGVPFFVLAGTFAVSGAQTPAHFSQALSTAWEYHVKAVTTS